MLAKLIQKNGERYFQTMQGHTIDSLKILRAYLDKNSDLIKQFCKRWNMPHEHFLKNIFIVVYLHDIAKFTKEFQQNLNRGVYSAHVPHAFFSVPILFELYKKKIIVPLVPEMPLEMLAILGHHTQLHDTLYDNITTIPHFYEETIIAFINKMPKRRSEEGFGFFDLSLEKIRKISFYDLNPEEDVKEELFHQIKEVRKDLISRSAEIRDKPKLKSILSFMHSILKTCDNYSSANFEEYINRYSGKKRTFDSVLKDGRKYVPVFEIDENKILLRVLGDKKPFAFQEKIFGQQKPFLLFFAPCGRGKTEAALIWAFKVCRKYNRNKIIFAMPTQITSNYMRCRFCDLFGKENVGFFHGRSLIKLKEERKKELKKESLDEQEIEEPHSENFKGKIFFKPITITTIDHLIYSFVHGFTQADFALGNIQNAVIVFDEVHYYEKQTLEHLIRLFGLLKEMEIPHLLMSGTLPSFIIENAKSLNSEYDLIVDEEGQNFTPFKVVKVNRRLINGANVDQDTLEKIIREYKKGKTQFVILNTIERAKSFYKEVRKSIGQKSDTFLYHSQFTYGDRAKKENTIIKKLKKEKTGPVLLIATQVIEISLDISCDIMYTELAPSDAIGQRGGRLNRGKKNPEGKMFIFLPENEKPYRKDLVDSAVFSEGAYSYGKLREICDKQYGHDYLQGDSDFMEFFEKCVVFGYSPWDLTHGTEDESRLFKIRSDDVQKIDVIPHIYYVDSESLKDENLASVPLWWYSRGLQGEGAEFFESVSKKRGKREKNYLVCKIPYSDEIGFDLQNFFSTNEGGKIRSNNIL